MLWLLGAWRGCPSQVRSFLERQQLESECTSPMQTHQWTECLHPQPLIKCFCTSCPNHHKVRTASTPEVTEIILTRQSKLLTLPPSFLPQDTRKKAPVHISTCSSCLLYNLSHVMCNVSSSWGLCLQQTTARPMSPDLLALPHWKNKTYIANTC